MKLPIHISASSFAGCQSDAFTENHRLPALVWLQAAVEVGGEPSRWTGWIDSGGVVAAASLLILLCVIAWGTNLIALPGNWLAVMLLAGYAWLGPAEGRAGIGYGPVLAASFFALLGEVLEFLASALGAQRAGASRRSTVLAVIGSFIGAMLGAIIGIPVPVVGPILAAVLFAGLGATLGAMWGEWSDGRPWRENWKIGHAAFWGRTLGTLGKIIAGFGILVIAVLSILL